MQDKIITSPYTPTDARALAVIFYYSIHQIACHNYAEEQLNAWAPPCTLQLEDCQQK